MNMSSWLVGQTWRVLHGATEEAFILLHVAVDHNSEVLVRRAPESSQIVVVGGIDDLPIKEVTGAKKDARNATFAEVTSLDDGVYGLQHVGGIQFEGSGDEHSLQTLQNGIIVWV